jgi:hypothetical protein
MAQLAASPPLAHSRAGTVYLVLDDIGGLGYAYRETGAARTEPKTVVADLISGQYRHPLRVVAFNTAEGWARDGSADIAREVRTRAREFEQELPAAVRDFVARASAWSSPEPTPVRCRTAPSSAATQAARRLKDTARPHARRRDEPSLMRHGISVA